MSLKDRITEDMKAAMRAKEADRLLTIRGLLAAIKQKEVDERITVDDAGLVAIIDKLIKQRKDSISQFGAAGRVLRRDGSFAARSKLWILDADGKNLLAPSTLLAGFANPALLTVVALLVMGAGLARTGVLEAGAGLLFRYGRGHAAIAPAIAAWVSASPPSETALRIASSKSSESRKAVMASGTDPGQVRSGL